MSLLDSGVGHRRVGGCSSVVKGTLDDILHGLAACCAYTAYTVPKWSCHCCAPNRHTMEKSELPPVPKSDAADQEQLPNPHREQTKSDSEKNFYTAQRDAQLELQV